MRADALHLNGREKQLTPAGFAALKAAINADGEDALAPPRVLALGALSNWDRVLVLARAEYLGEAGLADYVGAVLERIETCCDDCGKNASWAKRCDARSALNLLRRNLRDPYCEGFKDVALAEAIDILKTHLSRRDLFRKPFYARTPEEPTPPYRLARLADARKFAEPEPRIDLSGVRPESLPGDFPAYQKNLRAAWFEAVETCDPWVETGPIGEGRSRSVRVRNTFNGMPGIAKPGLKAAPEEYHCRAANEKIAFDLAYLLGLPVSATLLWRADAPQPYRRGRAISAWAFRQYIKWTDAQRRGYITQDHCESAAITFSMMRTFHTWIADTDRRGDHILLDVGSPAGDVRLAFIDHERSLSQTWSQPNTRLGICRHYIPEIPQAPEAAAQCAAAIAALDESEIEYVVARVPDLYLPPIQRNLTLEHLLARRAKLPELLGL